MAWLDRIVHGFIMTFGITQPTPAKKRAANLTIGGLLLLVILGLLAVLAIAVNALRH